MRVCNFDVLSDSLSVYTHAKVLDHGVLSHLCMCARAYVCVGGGCGGCGGGGYGGCGWGRMGCAKVLDHVVLLAPHRYGFIEYTEENAANEAVAAMNLFDLGVSAFSSCILFM